MLLCDVRETYGESVCLGQVLYDVRGILEKNRDTFRDDILFILKDSRYHTLCPLHAEHTPV